MKLTVELRRLNKVDASDEKIGDITYENGKVTATNMGDATMRMVMREPIILDDNRMIRRNAEPLLFMQNLHKYYRSPYLRATKATLTGA